MSAETLYDAPALRGCDIIPLDGAKPMARTLGDDGPSEHDFCGIWSGERVRVLVARGLWGVAAGLRHDISERSAVYILLSRRAYVGQAWSLASRGADRLLHGANLVAVFHPSLSSPVQLSALERVTYAAMLAGRCVTPFQREPAPGGIKTLGPAVKIWNEARGILEQVAPQIAHPWPGPLARVRREALQGQRPIAETTWKLQGRQACLLEFADGMVVVRAGSQVLHATGWTIDTMELRDAAMLEDDVLLCDAAFTSINAARLFLVGRDAKVRRHVQIAAAVSIHALRHDVSALRRSAGRRPRWRNNRVHGAEE